MLTRLEPSRNERRDVERTLNRRQRRDRRQECPRNRGKCRNGAGSTVLRAGRLTTVFLRDGASSVVLRGLAHFGEAAIVGVVCEFEEELAGRRAGREVKRGAVVGDPVGTRGEKWPVTGRGANRENTAAGGLAGTRAGGGVFNDDTILRDETDRACAFEIGLGVGFAILDI